MSYYSDSEYPDDDFAHYQKKGYLMRLNRKSINRKPKPKRIAFPTPFNLPSIKKMKEETEVNVYNEVVMEKLFFAEDSNGVKRLQKKETTLREIKREQYEIFREKQRIKNRGKNSNKKRSKNKRKKGSRKK